MAQSTDPGTFSALMQWLREHGHSALALPLRRKGIGSLTALLAADSARLKEAGCPEDLAELVRRAGARGASAGAEGEAGATSGRPSASTSEAQGRRTNPGPSRASAPGAKTDDEVSDLFKGARVTINGLQSNADLNGKAGIVVGFEESKGRWIVELGDSLGKKLFREANLFVPASEAPRQTRSPAEVVAAAAELAAADAKARPARSREVAAPAAKAAPSAPEAALAGPSARPAVTADAAGAPEGPALEAEIAPAALGGRPLRPGAQVLVERGGAAGQLVEPETCRVGQVGVCELCDFAMGKWRVRFADGGEEALPASRLAERLPTLRPGAYVRVRSGRNPSGFGAGFGICEAFDSATQQWSVRFENGDRQDFDVASLHAHDGSARHGRHEDKLGLSMQDQEFLSAMDDALSSGQLSWLDC
mmetsp:Transcript_63340/g.182240  ORF Transcript_63340/g.182240 Transcript_63340/m.182240 type:complete len:420 (+) Transcript_63340:65-1324(+)